MNSKELKFVNFKEMLRDAKEKHYAVAHFNINNLEWAKYILEQMEILNRPVILGVSEGAKRYMGGFKTVVQMVDGLGNDLKITIPVCLHLDHGSSFEICKEAIDAGFSSVMIDASKYPLEKNMEITRKVVEYAHDRGVSVEAEVGHIGGSEDNVSSTSLNATLDECIKMASIDIDALAPALGSVHGLYHGEPNLDFSSMKEINDTLTIPLVLHGGTGIPYEKIKQAIDCGISKININTELQLVWHEEVVRFVLDNRSVYDPRKVIGSGQEKMKEKISELIAVFKTPSLGNKNDESNII